MSLSKMLQDTLEKDIFIEIFSLKFSSMHATLSKLLLNPSEMFFQTKWTC